MRLLLDTHVFLWYLTADPRLPAAFRAAIQEPANHVFLSVASVWEAVIKYAIGKLPLPEPPDQYLPRERERHRIATLAIKEGVFLHLAKLPPLHPDPFDRLLVAQAMQYDLTILTVDDAVKAYPAKFLPV